MGISWAIKDFATEAEAAAWTDTESAWGAPEGYRYRRDVWEKPEGGFRARVHRSHLVPVR